MTTKKLLVLEKKVIYFLIHVSEVFLLEQNNTSKSGKTQEVI